MFDLALYKESHKNKLSSGPLVNLSMRSSYTSLVTAFPSSFHLSSFRTVNVETVQAQRIKTEKASRS